MKLENAILVARIAHNGQTDKAGVPYIFHPLEVMRCVGERNEDWTLPAAAVLHDVVEDTDVTMDDLKAAGFPDDLLVTLDHLTRRTGEAYLDYIERVMLDKNAMIVKKQDLIHNLDHSRLMKIKKTERKGLATRYCKAFQMILDHEAAAWNTRAESEGDDDT